MQRRSRRTLEARGLATADNGFCPEAGPDVDWSGSIAKKFFSPTLDAQRCDHHILAGFKDAVQNLTRTDGPGNSEPPSPDLCPGTDCPGLWQPPPTRPEGDSGSRHRSRNRNLTWRCLGLSSTHCIDDSRPRHDAVITASGCRPRSCPATGHGYDSRKRREVVGISKRSCPRQRS
jgi:hypothetical protein